MVGHRSNQFVSVPKVLREKSKLYSGSVVLLCSGHQNMMRQLCLMATTYKEKSEIWWQKFIKQCHVTGFIEKKLKTIIKKSGHYAVQEVLHVLPKAHEELAKDNPMILLNEGSSTAAINRPSMAHNDAQGIMQQSGGCDRKGKGTHGLIVVRKLLADKEN